jgi:translation initiation factor 1
MFALKGGSNELKVLYISLPYVTVRTMAEICSICGLPRDICVCGEISKEQQRIRVRLETRKFRRAVTIIDGINDKDTDLGRLAQKLKAFCACGGTAKNSQIILQGDHRQKVYSYLLQMGYPQENIELQ